MTTTPTTVDTIGIRSARYVEIPTKRIPALSEPKREVLVRSTRRRDD